MIEFLKARKDLAIAVGLFLAAVFLTSNIHSGKAYEMDRLTELVEKEEQKTTLLRELKVIEKRTKKTKEKLFAKDSSEMIAEVSRITNRAGLVVNSLSPSTQRSKDGVKLVVTADIRSGYVDLIDFLEDFETLDRMIVLRNIYIGKSGKYNEDKMLNIRMDFFTIKK